ncbi:pilus assembly protein CpaB [Enterobacter asburiae]|uniref:hypothetical protein n=1 Tax=Enterobacter asburiae TaxID=61645 RepID=UPI00141BE004|nr:hypothetical protein [Enterobacter asburiae]NIH92212.1 pilus assembly protein CpaB [Enterobacter asburiae]
MNHRILFFLSIIIIIIGSGGIFLQLSSNERREQQEKNTPQKTSATHMVLAAEASRDLKAGEIINAEDYQLVNLKSSTANNNIIDISAISEGGIRGYLLTTNTQKGSYLTPSTLLSPTDPEYAKRSIGVNEMPYSFPIPFVDNYLLSSTQSGDKVALYIRVKEIEKGKTEMVGLADEDEESSASYRAQTPKYAVSQVFDQVTVLDTKLYSSTREEDSSYNKDNNRIIGAVILRLNQKQLATLRTIEKAGQLFLLPASKTQQSIKRTSMDDVLPQLRSIKELRGSK